MKIHHYLHEQAFGNTEVERIDPKTITCKLPGVNETIHLAVDERERRLLAVFDGDILFAGLPKTVTVVNSMPLGVISCPSSSVRKAPEYHCEARPNYRESSGRTEVEIYRHFLLLPSCTAIVRKYRNSSLSPIYVIIRVFSNKLGEKTAEWQTTSY